MSDRMKAGRTAECFVVGKARSSPDQSVMLCVFRGVMNLLCVLKCDKLAVCTEM